MSQPSYRRQRDGGDQEVLISFWRSRRTVIHELPVEFNAYGWEMDHSARPPWWLHTRVAHKLPGVTLMPVASEAAWRDARAGAGAPLPRRTFEGAARKCYDAGFFRPLRLGGATPT